MADKDVPFAVEDIVQTPLPGYVAPTAVSFSPDDSLITYLFSPEKNLNRRVYAFDVNKEESNLVFSPPDGGVDESNISPEEKLRRERLRERGLGVTRYEWVKTNSKMRFIVVPLPAGVYMKDLSSSPNPELIVPSSPTSPIIDPRLSPNGLFLAYVRDSELHVLNLLKNQTQQLTTGANGSTLIHGLAEYIAQEEMDRRNGYWWSLDSKFIAYTEVDSSQIPLFRIMHQGKRSVGSEAQEDHAYPFPGALNSTLRLGVVSSAGGGKTTWMNLVCGGRTNTEDEYLGRVNWLPGNVLTVQVLNRSQSKLKIISFDINTGQGNVLLTEESDAWVTLHDCFTPLEKVPSSRGSGGFIWASERTGFRHLYLYESDGTCLGAITSGEWMVEQIAGVNEPMSLVYFTGTLDGPLETNLYCTKLEAGDASRCQPMRLTHGKGKHIVVLDHQMKNFVDIHDSVDSPPRVSLCSLSDGTVLKILYEQTSPIQILKSLKLEPPEFVQIQANDGKTTLYGAVYKPDSLKFGPPPYKTMINVYGGPSVQLVHDSWINTVDMRTQYLRSRGILVWKLDNRGTARRGLKFESWMKHNCGYVDAEDQVTGAKWLIEQGLAKADHIGVYGWSYGGYLSATLLTRYPEIFNCAVSGAPVTSWDGYDSFYTEKYMGLPTEEERYLKSSVMHHVGNLTDKQKLMLVHGMIDENVHFRHTARLMNALVEAGKRYELLIFPDERHMPRKKKDRIYMEQRIWEFIEKNL
ncbi:Peptidase S9 prolyl oligopeptidase catalytic domain [Arabidopsis thaliana x Arabidopsis arenosa]|uniref:Peptidase S9 prolyl oligopeptidase catalytic domain n=1 Tax=Arabidopsis thaliana x Arabidopsis arenosa TaxID=1240361 RepID=A0A8T1YYY1_9BRAS|nr:Peptidase S9 prolyl oligopeptidase catalytic domain [Arabidopsis thaliana x Arabidopsis arenosa]